MTRAGVSQQEFLDGSASAEIEAAQAASSISDEEESSQALGWAEAIRIGLVALVALAVRFRPWAPLDHTSFVGGFGLLIGGWPILKEAAENIAARRMTMELSMSIAIVAAAAISEFFTALIITLFVLIAEVIENMTVSRGRRAIRNLLEFLPHTVTLRGADGIRQASAEEIGVGDSVLVNPGGLVPVDGVVLSGHSFVDQARITGESVPAEKLPGAAVYAGTINQSGALEIRVEPALGRHHRVAPVVAEPRLLATDCANLGHRRPSVASRASRSGRLWCEPA